MINIDKIYLTGDQYLEFQVWVYNRIFWIILLTWQNPIWCFYDIPKEAYKIGFEQKEYPATNFPQIIDQYLFLHCKLPYIQKRLREQYGNLFNCLAPIWVIRLIDKLKH